MIPARTGTSEPCPTPGRPTSLREGVAPADHRLAELLTALGRTADAEGLVTPRVRAVAAELGWTTVAVRGGVAALVRDGRLLAVGAGALALPGTPAGDLADTGPAGPRTPVHDAVHEGTGSAVLW